MGYTFWNYRRRLYMVILFFLILFSFAAVSTDLWIQWTIVTAMFAVLVITDFMFLGSGTFVFDPSYRSWQVATGEDSQY